MWWFGGISPTCSLRCFWKRNNRCCCILSIASITHFFHSEPTESLLDVTPELHFVWNLCKQQYMTTALRFVSNRITSDIIDNSITLLCQLCSSKISYKYNKNNNKWQQHCALCQIESPWISYEHYALYEVNWKALPFKMWSWNFYSLSHMNTIDNSITPLCQLSSSYICWINWIVNN